MEWRHLIPVYVFCWLVTGAALVESLTAKDVAASYFAALAWPVLIPAGLLRWALRRLRA
jgi:hypothetical protein